MRRVGPVAAVLAAALAGCTPPPPERIAGDPAPVAVAPTGGVPSAPTRPPGSPTPADVPQLPTGYQGFELTRHGVTARLPVPSDWLRRPLSTQPGDVRTEFVDRTGVQKFRVEIIARDKGETARQAFEAYEPTVKLDDYTRLDLVDVPDVGESAVDWSFTFRDGGGLRQVIDRMIVQGSARLAVYYSTLQPDFQRLEPIWRYAVAQLVIEPH